MLDRAVRTSQLINRALAVFVEGAGSAQTPPTVDAGPAVLVGLEWRRTAKAAAGDLPKVVLARWFDWVERAFAQVGLYGGAAGMFAGARLAMSAEPSLASIADELRLRLSQPALFAIEGGDDIEWHHYDLVLGPSGVVLGLTVAADCRASDLDAALGALLARFRDDDLDGLRVTGYRADPLRSWNNGRINTGMAHGVGGVVAALCAAHARFPELRALVGGVLRKACDWLVAQSYTDARNLITWPIGGFDERTRDRGTSRRQGWCYGTPGLAWVLWDAGCTLGDFALCDLAAEAMHSFCQAFDPRVYIDDGPIDDALGLCHGAAGILALADAFACHAHHTEAERLAVELEDYLWARADDILELADSNMTLLTGASGVLAALDLRQGGDRTWLPLMGMR